MPLPLPRLDNRTFDQLVTEGKVLISRLAPQWTDYNAHDPGITLIELLAWLTESDLYRLDRTTAASYRAFLRLVGVEPRLATVAETVVGAIPTPPFTVAVVARGTRVESSDGGVRFQTVHDTGVSVAQLVSFTTSDPIARLDDGLYVSFDRALVATASPLAIYVSTDFDDEDRQTRARLEAEWGSAHLHYSARVVWEYYTGDQQWMPLEAVDDETRALTLSGLVRFTVPAAAPHVAGGVDTDGAASGFWIRGRLVSGGYDCPPRIRSVLFNALRVRHAVDVDAVRLLTDHSTGRAAQLFAAGDTPIVPGTVDVAVAVNGTVDGPWREVPNWDGVGPADRAFLVVHDRGEILFGDGRVGRVPPAGAEIRATYHVGGGVSGNVPAGTLTKISSSARQVVQPLAASGGARAEEIDDAIGRALESFAAPSRAVTLVDFETLTRSVPGVPVARAHAIADYDPALACLPAAGSVTVVVVPPCPPSRPEPSEALLCAVAAYLEPRRTLTTELHVVGPSYTVVSVAARLHPLSDVDVRRLGDLARTTLDRFLDPLHGGADGTGWPIGREVYRSEVMALLNDLPGVSYVDEVALRAGDGPSDRCGNVAMCPHGLVAPGTHQITIESGSRCQ